MLALKKSLHLGKNSYFRNPDKMGVLLRSFQKNKTVYAHAKLEEEEGAAIGCVIFDRANRFVITGADDAYVTFSRAPLEIRGFFFSYFPRTYRCFFSRRLIKVWALSDASLQAVLHGHADVITDLDISFCNSLIISSSKDATIRFWNLQETRHVHVSHDHAEPINNVRVINARITASTFREFLLSCSDDGKIHIYDVETVRRLDRE